MCVISRRKVARPLGTPPLESCRVIEIEAEVEGHSLPAERLTFQVFGFGSPPDLPIRFGRIRLEETQFLESVGRIFDRARRRIERQQTDRGVGAGLSDPFAYLVEFDSLAALMGSPAHLSDLMSNLLAEEVLEVVLGPPRSGASHVVSSLDDVARDGSMVVLQCTVYRLADESGAAGASPRG